MERSVSTRVSWRAGMTDEVKELLEDGAGVTAAVGVPEPDGR
jgi:hypothetical protein